MNQINIARQLAKERRKLGISQEELASYMGVSKAAVSKWENCQSYPDITLLPKLASFYNISVDELIGYEPQMQQDEIHRLYRRLSDDFACRPFDEVMADCDEIIKKYYSCFPLLLQMSTLLLNHAILSKDPATVYERASALANRVRTKSDDIDTAKDASILLASCYLVMGQPTKALEMQNECIHPFVQDTELLAQTYQELGNVSKAKRTYQISMYQHLVILCGDAAPYLMLCADDLAKAEEIIKRNLRMLSLFHLNALHPNIGLSFYIVAAQVYCIHDKKEDALKMLESYTSLCLSLTYPLILHGDEYFNMIDDWFIGFDIGSQAPRNERTIKSSLIQWVSSNPYFKVLSDLPKYKGILKRLETIQGEK